MEIFKIYEESFRLGYSGYSYRELRETHKEYNSLIDANALYDARMLRKSVLKQHHYPKQLNPQPLLRKQDFKIKGNQIEIIYKPRSRLVAKIFPSEKQLKKMSQAETKGARLVNRDGKFFLNLVLEKDVQMSLWEDCETVIGVDIGVNYLAVCSAYRNSRFTNPVFFKGGEWKHICDRKRKVTRIAEYEHLTNRQHEILHTVSKKIVEYAKQFPKPIIVLEKLGRFANNTFNKRWNFLLGNWARKKLQFMIEYKAKWEGIPVAYVNPAYTSLYCHYCGSKGKREGVVFECQNCGRRYNADANAAMNLAKKFRQFLDEPKAMTGERSLTDLSSVKEGETCLPRQAQIRQGNGNQMKRMKALQTLSVPLGLGGD